MLPAPNPYGNSLFFLKLHLSDGQGRNAFTAYGPGYVAVNGVRYERSVIVLPDRPVAEWSAVDFEALTTADFAALVPLDAEVVLFGTGATLRFPPRALLQPLIDAEIGVEVMDVQAACRTYNILLNEDRRVAAALLLG
jgi:uncharacterized protein